MASEHKTQTDFSYLGWNPVEIVIGSSLFGAGQSDVVKPDFQTGGIRNCSYAPGKQWIGITAEDRSNGGQVVAVYERVQARTQVLVRKDYLLHHALNPSATKLVYTEPSEKTGTADLHLLNLDTGQSRPLLKGHLAQDSVPSWFPDDTHLAYHTAQGSIEMLDITTSQQQVLDKGHSPAVSPDGTQIAFRQGNTLLILSVQTSQIQQVLPEKQIMRNVFTDGISWSPDGTSLSFGVIAGATGKQTDFYILDIKSGKHRKTKTKYVSGLLLLDNQPA